MTKLEELKAEMIAAIKSVNVSFEAAYDAEDAYYEELKKQETAQALCELAELDSEEIMGEL